MAVTIPAGFGQLSFVFTGSFGTAPFVTTLGVDLTDVTTGQMAAYLERWEEAFVDHLAIALDSDMALSEIRLTIPVTGGLGTVVHVTTNGGGARSGASAPINVAFILEKVTGQPGRRNRGRMFWPGLIPRDALDLSGMLNDATTNDLASTVETFINAGTGTDPLDDPSTFPVLLHSGPSAPTPLTDLVGVRKVGTLKQRLR